MGHAGVMFQWFSRSLQGFDRRLWILFGGRMISATGFSIVMPFLSIFLYTQMGVPMTVVGLVFLFACRRLAQGTPNGHAFLYVGMALALIFGIVALLSLLAQGAEIVIFGDGEPWDPIQILVPMVYLALVPAIGLYTWGRGFIGNLIGV